MIEGVEVNPRRFRLYDAAIQPDEFGLDKSDLIAYLNCLATVVAFARKGCLEDR